MGTVVYTCRGCREAVYVTEQYDDGHQSHHAKWQITVDMTHPPGMNQDCQEFMGQLREHLQLMLEMNMKQMTGMMRDLLNSLPGNQMELSPDASWVGFAKPGDSVVERVTPI